MSVKNFIISTLAVLSISLLLCDNGNGPEDPTSDMWKGSITDTIISLVHNFTYTLVSDNTFELRDTVSTGGMLVESGSYQENGTTVTFTPAVNFYFNTQTFTIDTLKPTKSAYTGSINGTGMIIAGFIDIGIVPKVLGDLTVTKQ